MQMQVSSLSGLVVHTTFSQDLIIFFKVSNMDLMFKKSFVRAWNLAIFLGVLIELAMS